MNFSLWLACAECGTCLEPQVAIEETSAQGLWDSAVDAFPNTTKRQHVRHSVKINDVKITTFLGLKTLLIRSQADNRSGGGGVYNPVVLFRNVEYHDSPGPNVVEITASDNGQPAFLTLPNDNDVLVRCQCDDWRWRFHFYNHLDHSSYGSNRKPYVSLGVGPPANPTESPGLCKHVMAMVDFLRENGLMA